MHGAVGVADLVLDFFFSTQNFFAALRPGSTCPSSQT